MKLFLILFILTTTIFANSIELKQTYFIDKTNSLDFKNIIKKQNDFKAIKKFNLGVTHNNIWVHLSLKNNTNKLLEKRIHNKRAGIDFIDVFIIKNNQIIKTYKLGDMLKYKNRDNIFRISYFDIKLQALEEVDIYIKQKSYSAMDIRWHITDIKNFEEYYHTQTVIYSTIFGMLFITIIATFMLFFFLKNKFYLIYACFTSGTIIYQFALAGFFYQAHAHTYLITFLNFPFPMLVLVLLSLFPFYFFDIKKNEFKITLFILKTLIILLLICSILEIFFPFNYDILYLTKYTTLISFVTILTLLILSIKIFLAKKRSSIFYLLSNLALFFFITIYLLVLIGVIKHFDFYYYTLSIGAISQDIFLALALVQSTYLIKKEHDKNNQLLNEYSKLSFIGQTMINISHQWKSPINSIYNNINHIEVAREFNDPKLKEIIDENLNSIKQTTLYLKDTALNQLNFYKDKTKQEKINVYDEINNVIKLIENEFNKKSIDIEFNCDKNLTIECEKNYFLNILMILFENSFKIFEKRDIKKPYIKLSIQKTNNKLKIDFKDNAKGTSQENITKIFDKNYSLNDSTGIGLYLAKEIITYKLKGEISAQNIKDGICFKIII